MNAMVSDADIKEVFNYAECWAEQLEQEARTFGWLSSEELSGMLAEALQAQKKIAVVREYIQRHLP